MLKKIGIRNPKKGYYGVVVKIPKDLEKQKTIKVELKKRMYISKYKRYYYKSFRYQVHCDLSVKEFNKSDKKKLSLGEKVYVTYTNRISSKKSSVVLF